MGAYRRRVRLFTLILFLRDLNTSLPLHRKHIEKFDFGFTMSSYISTHVRLAHKVQVGFPGQHTLEEVDPWIRLIMKWATD